jgi:hypothetical protein
MRTKRTSKLGYTVLVCGPGPSEPCFFVEGAGVRAEEAGSFATDLGLLVEQFWAGVWVA